MTVTNLAETFTNQSLNGINFTAISAVETVVGAPHTTLPFLPAAQPLATTLLAPTFTSTALMWGALNGGIGTPGTSDHIVISYTATDTNVGQGIAGTLLNLSMDALVGTGVQVTGEIQAYNGYTLVGQNSISSANPFTPSATTQPGDISLTHAYQSLNIVVTLDLIDPINTSVLDYGLYSIIQTGVQQGALPVVVVPPPVVCHSGDNECVTQSLLSQGCKWNDTSPSPVSILHCDTHDVVKDITAGCNQYVQPQYNCSGSQLQEQSYGCVNLVQYADTSSIDYYAHCNADGCGHN